MKFVAISFSIILILKISIMLLNIFKTYKIIKKTDILLKLKNCEMQFRLLLNDIFLTFFPLPIIYLFIKLNSSYLISYEIYILIFISISSLISILTDKFSESTITKLGVIYFGKLYTWNKMLDFNIDNDKSKITFRFKHDRIVNYEETIDLKVSHNEIKYVEKIIGQNIM